jgi:hypothetical protein
MFKASRLTLLFLFARVLRVPIKVRDSWYGAQTGDGGSNVILQPLASTITEPVPSPNVTGFDDD